MFSPEKNSPVYLRLHFIIFQVLLPVPDYVYTMLPLDQMKTMTFSITPVLFNVGINEKATLAHKMGLNGPQEKNNIDNFKALAEYYRRYKKLHLNTATSKNGKSKAKFFTCYMYSKEQPKRLFSHFIKHNTLNKVSIHTLRYRYTLD